jgi:hypothetical protein
MGKAKDWQSELTTALANMQVTVLNPRCDDWDPDWKQDILNKPFKDQVDWEMNYLDNADVIALYLQPGTLSPISLLELGLYVKEKKKQMVVCCPDGFRRRGNVQIVCERYGTSFVDTQEDLISKFKERLLAASEAQSWWDLVRSIFLRFIYALASMC